jgi:hypothetical protein
MGILIFINYLNTIHLKIMLLEIDVSHAFDRLTEPVPYKIPSLGRVVTKATSKLHIRPEDAPIPSELLNKILLVCMISLCTDSIY